MVQMKKVIKRLTNYRYLRMIFKKLVNNIKNIDYRCIFKKLWNDIRMYLQMIFKYILDNIGESPLKWLSCITILLSFFLFDSFWVTWINKIWVDPIASQIKDNTWWVVIIYSVVVSVFYYHGIQEMEMINKNRCKAVVIAALLYCLCLFSGKWDYILIFDCCRYFAWSNLIFMIPVIWEFCIYYHLEHKKATENIEPKLEIEKTNNVADSYKRRAVCKSAYKTLESCFYKEGSFTFSITGIWGSGKTTFINILKEQYSRNNSVKSIIIFEPWKSDTSDSIVKGFFAMLRDELSNYIPNISSTIDQYVELLLDEESGKPLKIIGKSLHGIFNEDKNPYELIKEILERTKHKTVVFIDDIDRLNAAEIKEVLRLIRNTANFPYIQFIVAYDKNYVCETLKNSKINTPDRYLEKFFNVEMSLPKSEERVICNELLTRIQGTINTIWGLEKEDTKISNMVYYNPNNPTNNIIGNNLVTQVLFTVRDVIRFHNSFYLLAKAYKDQKVENEICFQDLFFIELLRYRYMDVYTILCNRPFVLLSLNDNVFLLNDNYKSIIQNNLSNDEYTEVVTDILEYLFRNRSKDKAIYNLRSYSKYFMYRLDDKILTVDELMSLTEKGDSEIIESANQLYKSKYRLEFENQIEELLVQIYKSNKEGLILNYIEIYNLLEKLVKSNNNGLRDEVFNAIITHLQHLRCIDKRHFKALLHLYDIVDFNSKTIKYFDILNFLTTILSKKNLTLKLQYPIGQEEHDIVYDFLANTTHPAIISSALSSFKESIENGDKAIINDLLIDLSVLSDIQLKHFENEQNKFSEDGFTLFYNCKSKTDPKTHRVYLRQEALNIMKNEILKNPKGYFSMFIRKGQTSNPEFNTVSPEPFCAQIFGNYGNFEEFLEKCKDDNQYTIRAKNFWELYKNNGYKPIEFNGQGNVKEKIDNNFKHEIILLNQLKRIMKYAKSGSVAKDRLKQILAKNDLNIKLKYDILLSTKD